MDDRAPKDGALGRRTIKAEQKEAEPACTLLAGARFLSVSDLLMRDGTASLHPFTCQQNLDYQGNHAFSTTRQCEEM
jgi:hypothetical protein